LTGEGATSWLSVVLTGLTADDFIPGTGTHPDFSSSGGVIGFGFARSNTNPGGTSIETQHGVDNWSFTLHVAAVADVEGSRASDGPMIRITGSNPFAGRLHYVVSRPAAGRTAVTVLDLDGRVVRSLEDREFPTGATELTSSGTDASGRQVAPGIYIFARPGRRPRGDGRVVSMR
jgi:hypothetical protein